MGRLARAAAAGFILAASAAPSKGSDTSYVIVPFDFHFEDLHVDGGNKDIGDVFNVTFAPLDDALFGGAWHGKMHGGSVSGCWLAWVQVPGN